MAAHTRTVFFDDRPHCQHHCMSKIASHEEVLELLSEQARKGSVTAAAALERALRTAAKEHKEEDAFDRALAGYPRMGTAPTHGDGSDPTHS